MTTRPPLVGVDEDSSFKVDVIRKEIGETDLDSAGIDLTTPFVILNIGPTSHACSTAVLAAKCLHDIIIFYFSLSNTFSSVVNFS